MKRETILTIITFLFGLLFLYTGGIKLLTYKSFVWDLGRDPYIGTGIANVVGVALPVIEIVVGTMVLVDRTRKWGLWFSLLLMTVFTIYVRWMINDPTRHCTCGGVIRAMTWRQHFWFNMGFAILAAVGVWLVSSKSKYSWNAGRFSREKKYDTA
ncbi:MauE/DoxX family redox-associated membrane protein [Dinghuibacter silviterrae]|uniref:Methylamine utilisation protein MauE domain-containing protein n=1 Tax=Dinghuibacter silviterrae TaxID=1539049 RepID=A0A4V3GLR2_9BACT|nr:MauE/DoxX family redox-associated membrane protein [Dinghuibacter silviterrae]TDX00473.1 hypothetical protein EDB95_1498 [Dinghuibacter silviterrae]